MNNPAITVLLVEDNDMIRECITAYLEDEGFTVHSYVTAEQALERIVAINPVVCISDMRLPGMDGESFILKAHTLCPVTSFLLHTGILYTLSDELRDIGMTDGDVLLKPIHDLSKLVKRITHISVTGRG
ncbi:MAG TPA: response regulator [Desulfuromonadales bacterium]|nr:response regulator [Desulfuromonadales bacterium]